MTVRPPLPAPPPGYRPHMPLRVKLAAALHALGLDPDDVDFDHAPPLMQREWDPNACDTIPPANEPSAIVPRARGEHKAKTAKVDVPQIAKTKRLSKTQKAFRSAMLSKGEAAPESAPAKKKRKLQGRPFEKGRLQGRGFRT
jgi:hypothetical protein